MRTVKIDPKMYFAKLPYDVRAHCIRTGKSIVAMAAYCDELDGYFGKENRRLLVKAIQDGGRYHDIGKIMLSEAILNKTGKLTESEWRAMKQHPLRSAEVIESFPKDFFPSQIHREIVIAMGKYHHERYNGTGYPFGLAGENIPLIARLGAIADVFDALVSKRSYKNKISVGQADKIILEGETEQFGRAATSGYRQAFSEIANIYRRV